MVTDDLDGVLVGADGTVGAQAVEHAGAGAGGSGREGVAQLQAGAGHVVFNTHGEVVLHFAVQVVEHGLDHGGSELLGAQAVTAAHHLDVAAAGFDQRRAHIQVQRLAQGSGFLGPVQHRDLLHGLGQFLHHVFHAEGTIQMNLQNADLLAVLDHLVHGLVRHVAAGAHGDDDLLRIRSAFILEGLVGAARQLRDGVHALFHDGRHGQVELVSGFTALEVDVAVLGGTGLMRMFRIQGAGAELGNLVPRNQILDLFVAVLGVDGVDLLDFVAGTESVEEMQEGHGALQGRQMGYQSHIMRFLDRVGGQHGEAGLTAGHNVAVISEDVQRMIRQSAGADMEHSRGQLAADLVHVRDHQQQTLGSGEGGRQGAGGQGSVHSAGRAGFRLHLGNPHGLPEQVFPVMSGPFIRHFRHGGRRSDGVDGCHIAESVRDMADGGIAVNGDLDGHGCTSLEYRIPDWKPVSASCPEGHDQNTVSQTELL